jgi:uncharacterized protein
LLSADSGAGAGTKEILVDYLSVPARQARVVDVQDHRPWPLPSGPWVMGQTWDDLAFLHWRIDPEVLRPRVPASVQLDTFDGSAWLGVTPFRLEHLRIRGTLPVPRLSSFLETNVRTYVTVEDKPGIWFFSLDAESQVAVEAARRLYKLPYFRARMGAWPRGFDVEYEASRKDGRGHLAQLRATYGPDGAVFNAQPGTLEYFLTERYCMYATDEGGTLYRAEIHHPPWPLQPGHAEITLNTMPPPGIDLPDEPPLVHFSQRQDVVIWAPARA